MELNLKHLELKKIRFNNKTKNFLGFGYIYILEYNNKFIYFRYLRDINEDFRKILKEFYGYGVRGLDEIKPNFFLNYIKKEYKKVCEKTKKKELKKKWYYKQMRIKAREDKIKRLEQELNNLKNEPKVK